jgi:hypothetical protein
MVHTNFSELIRFKAPEGFTATVATAARREHVSVSQFLRQCLIANLREMGLPLAAEPASAEHPNGR